MATSRNDILINVLDDLCEEPYSRFKWKLNDVLQKEGRKKIPKRQLENMKKTDVIDVMIEIYGDDNAVTLAAKILENIKEVDLAETLKSEVQKFNETAELKPQTLSVALQGLKNTHKFLLKEKFECVSECIARPGEQLLLNTVFTKVHVTEGECSELNYHEVREIEKARSRVQPITCNDIFKPSEKNPRIRTVLTKGIAGIGKTFYLQKFILDWATGNNDYGFDFIFVFPFRELNLIKEEISLVELVQQDYKHMRGHEDVLSAGSKVLFIFDGLDESILKLDFENCKKMCDETKSTVLDDLLINLIKRNLLPSASLWITSRPAATSCIPPRYISRVTEIQGFEDQEKEEYFRKKFKDQALAEKIISRMRALRSLHVMCYVPAFCRIIATVLGHTLGVNGNKNIPKTLTEVYTNFLLVLLTLQNEKEEDKEELLKTNQVAILNLGRLAFLNLERNNLIFYEADLRECGIDIKQSVYSGVCREIFKEQSVVRDRVYSFVHLTVQEFFAALYVFTSFQNKRHNPLKQTLKDTFFDLVGGLLNGSLMDELPGLLFGECLSDVYKLALRKATKSRNGHLDLLVRFLLGLGMETNQKLLKGLLLNTKDNSRDIQKTAEYIKQLIEAHLSPEISINLFHCLCELNDGFLPAEFNVSLTSGGFSTPVLFSTDYSALAYVLQTSEAELDTLDLTRQTPLNEGLQRLMPVARLHRRLVLSGCGLTSDCCEDLASALCIRQSSVRELELGWNNLGDSGVKIISAALRDPNCKLEKLGLSGCGLTVNCCEDLASILCRNQSTLRELELGGNNLGDSGLKVISARLRYPKCKLEKLGLSICGLTSYCCEDLASALCTNQSTLRELELGDNNLGESGVKLISAALKNPNCKLEKLGLSWCDLTNDCCEHLSSVLCTNQSTLRELELGGNNLGDSGVKLISAALRDPNCKLEKLGLSGCGLTVNCCEDLASVLCTNQSTLRELELGWNNLGDSGVKLISAALRDPNCKLDKLGLRECRLTDDCCIAFASAQLTLKELELGDNNLGDSGVNLLTAALKDPNCKLEKLGFGSCRLTEFDQVTELTQFQPMMHHEESNKCYRFSFEKKGKYQCEITNLIFDVASPAEVVYGTELWEKCPLDQSSLLPAGPLFHIKCLSGALKYLSFPHSECSPEVQNHLMVAHYKNDCLKMIKPTEVTETHVTIEVLELSLLGLLRRQRRSEIRVLVLLFLRQINKTKKLNVFLLPSNVVVENVQEKQKDSILIEASSDCSLRESTKYSISCGRTYCHIQPNTYEFFKNYNPNVPRAFEIFLNKDVILLNLEVLKSSGGASVWSSTVSVSDLSSHHLVQYLPGDQILGMIQTLVSREVRDSVIQGLLDDMMEMRVLNDEEVEEVEGHTCTSEKTMCLIDMPFPIRERGGEVSQE